MAFYVKAALPKAVPLFAASTFLACVKWCLKAERGGILNHSQYEIHGQLVKRDPIELQAVFEIEQDLA